MNNTSNGVNHRIDRALASLKKEYILIGKTRVTAWHAWLLIGLAAGIVAGIILVASREGEFERGRAATTVAQPIPPTPPAFYNRLAGYWRFEEGAGGVAQDSSGSKNVGTLVNMDFATAWVGGKMGKALQFDGANDYIRLPDLNLHVLNDFTISAWIKSNKANNGLFFFSGQGTDLTGNWSIILSAYQGKIRFSLQGPGGGATA